jgi:hypothetical protein
MLRNVFSIALSLEHPFKTIKKVLFVVILGYMGYKVWGMESFFVSQGQYLSEHIFVHNGLFLGLALFLCPLNWAFEAMKWKEASKVLSPLRFVDAFRSVVMGQALNLVFPASIGHCAGRLLGMEQGAGSKIKAVGLVLVCQAVQMWVTIAACIVGCLYFGQRVIPFALDWEIAVALFMLAIFFALILFSFVRSMPWFQMFVCEVKKVPFQTVLAVVFYAVLRYLTFTTQFVLVLYFMGASAAWYQLGLALSLVFMAKSLMPTINFMSDLGVREFAALLFLPLLGLPEQMVVAASLWVWLINVLLPSLAGAFWLLKAKLNYLFC